MNITISGDLRLDQLFMSSHLLITVEYDQSIAQGPPFSVDADEVRTYWPDLIQLAVVDDFENCPPKFLAAGLTKFCELAWRRNG